MPSIETKANFTRPIKHDTGRVRAEGRVVGRGRQIMSAEARILDSAGRILAHGTSTMMVLGNGGPARPNHAGSNEMTANLDRRKQGASAFASSASTRRRTKSDGLRILVDRLWPRGPHQGKRRGSICGSRTRRRATNCAASFMAIPTTGRQFNAAYGKELAPEAAKGAASPVIFEQASPPAR